VDVTSTGPPDAEPSTVSLPGVTAPDIREVRRRVADAAVRVGIHPDDAAQFTVAVNEVVINAIRHGGGIADITIATKGDEVTVQVRDHGPGLPASASAALPPPDQLGGRGLWLVRQLCDNVTFHSSRSGTFVVLSAASGA